MVRWQWWWNGKWERLARRDVEIHRDEIWSVEARAGGPEGQSKRFTVAGQTEAQEIAKQLMQSNDRWRKMP